MQGGAPSKHSSCVFTAAVCSQALRFMFVSHADFSLSLPLAAIALIWVLGIGVTVTVCLGVCAILLVCSL